MSGGASPTEVKTQLVKNALFSSSSWGVTALINLAAIPIFIRYLGMEGYGIYLLLTGLFGYFGLLDFGLSDGVIKYVAHHTELQNHDSLNESVNAALLIQLVSGFIGVVTLWAFNHQIVRALHVSPSLVRVAVGGLYFSALGFFCKMLLNTLNAVLKGLQRFDVLAKMTMGFSLATTLVAVLVLVVGGRLLEVVVASALMTTANLAAVIFLLFRYVPRYRPAHRISREALRSLISFGAYTFITKVAGALNTYFLQVVIALILGAAAVAYFAVPLRFTTALEAGMTSLIGVIFPFVSALKARANIESLQEVYSSASKYAVALSTPLYLFIILFSQQILRLWLGAAFAQSSWLVLAFLAGGSLLAAWTMVPANTAFGTGHTKITAAFSLIVITTNVLFSVLFTLRWGATGTAAAVLLTAFQGPVFIWYVTSHVVRIPPRQYFAQVFAFHVAPALGFSLLSLGILWATKAQNGSPHLIAVASGAALTLLYYSLILRGGVVSVRGLSPVSEPAAFPGG